MRVALWNSASSKRRLCLSATDEKPGQLFTTPYPGVSGQVIGYLSFVSSENQDLCWLKVVDCFSSPVLMSIVQP
jgi:hypothetical protein